MPDTHTTETWVCPTLLFEDGRLRAGRALALRDGRVSDVADRDSLPASATTVAVDGIVAPGFVDLQVNGGGGVLINATPTQEAMWAVARAHRPFGTTAIFPTVITDSRDVLDRTVSAAIEACGMNGVAGLHIEGPHISVDRRGTHKAAFVRPLDDSTIAHIRRLRAAGVPTMVTVAPEVVTPAQIAAMVALGAVVSLGHSKATGDETRKALAAGATCATHLFNAMPPMTARGPGLAGAVINSQAYAGLICDGIHVSDDMLAMAIRARPVAGRMFLVSDAMPTVGGPPEFDLYGTTVHLEGHKLVNSEGSLAGAHTTMSEGVRCVADTLGFGLETALQMAITVPCRAMGLSLDALAGRDAGDLVLLDAAANVVGALNGVLADAPAG